MKARKPTRERVSEVTAKTTVRTCLWFRDQAHAAAEFYCSLLPDSRIERVEYYPESHDMGEAGTVLLVEFTLAGVPYQALNGGPHFTLDEAVSISVCTEDQTETDYLWAALTADGGAESQCGWLKDRFGLSWQILPKRSVELLRGPQAARVWTALMQMKKIDIATLEAATQAACVRTRRVDRVASRACPAKNVDAQLRKATS